MINNKFIYIVLFFVIEVVSFLIYYNFIDFKNILEFQKLFLEIFILFIGLLSGKLIYETINYIKENRVKNVDDICKKLLEYDNIINDIMQKAPNIKVKTDFDIAKAIVLLHTMEKIVEISSNNDNKIILNSILNHVKLKLIFNLGLKQFLKKDGEKFKFKKSLENQLELQLKDKNFLVNFLEDLNNFINKN